MNDLVLLLIKIGHHWQVLASMCFFSLVTMLVIVRINHLSLKRMGIYMVFMLGIYLATEVPRMFYQYYEYMNATGLRWSPTMFGTITMGTVVISMWIGYFIEVGLLEFRQNLTEAAARVFYYCANTLSESARRMAARRVSRKVPAVKSEMVLRLENILNNIDAIEVVKHDVTG